MFNKEQADFIRHELGYEVEGVDLNDETLSAIQDAAFDVEIEETIKAGDNELSNRGELAAGIVTLLGE